MLRIDRSLIEIIEGAAAACWPEECCGLLIGRAAGGVQVVEQVQEAANVSADDRRRRYEIDPHTAFDALRRSRVGGAQVVGFYHSHTDGSLEPSAHDVETAWPQKSYLIVAVAEGEVLSVGSWRLSLNGKSMLPERID